MAADALSEFWRARSTRERKVLGAGALLLAAALLYALVLAPLVESRAKLQQRLPKTRAETSLMQAQVEAIEKARAGTRAAAVPGNLAARVGLSAETVGVRAALREITPVADDQARVTGDAVPARALMAWLAELDKQGLRVTSCTLTPAAEGNNVALDMRIQGTAP
jgi:general secretion pathway protein M